MFKHDFAASADGPTSTESMNGYATFMIVCSSSTHVCLLLSSDPATITYEPSHDADEQNHLRAQRLETFLMKPLQDENHCVVLSQQTYPVYAYVLLNSYATHRVCSSRFLLTMCLKSIPPSHFRASLPPHRVR